MPIAPIGGCGLLGPVQGQSRIHTESDLRAFVTWCQERGLDPLAAQRPHVELYVRWMQEARRFKPSTVSRRMAVVAGFYRTTWLLPSNTLSEVQHWLISVPRPRREAEPFHGQVPTWRLPSRVACNWVPQHCCIRWPDVQWPYMSREVD